MSIWRPVGRLASQIRSIYRSADVLPGLIDLVRIRRRTHRATSVESLLYVNAKAQTPLVRFVLDLLYSPDRFLYTASA